MENKKSSLSTAALVLGIIGICTSFIPIINNASFILGVLSAIFGIVSVCRKRGVGKGIAGIILGILTVAFVISAQKSLSEGLNKGIDEINKSLENTQESLDNMSGDNTQSILQNYVDIELGNFEVKNNGYFSDTKMQVKVTNKSSETKSFSIEIEAVSQDGSRITYDTIYANSLSAGQSQNFDIFTFISSDKVTQMQGAKFNIFNVSMY